MHLTIPIVPNNNLLPNTGLRSPRKCSSSLALNSYSSTEKIASDVLEYTTASTTDLYLRPNSYDGSEGSRSVESVENGRCSEENLLSPNIASLKRLSIKKRQATISTPNLGRRAMDLLPLNQRYIRPGMIKKSIRKYFGILLIAPPQGEEQ
uniref:Uncharacterized protein n=1 Tax=Acrobeloides nanus TaxID=290746 RepID=A0A914CJF9_9BILA